MSKAWWNKNCQVKPPFPVNAVCAQASYSPLPWVWIETRPAHHSPVPEMASLINTAMCTYKFKLSDMFLKELLHYASLMSILLKLQKIFHCSCMVKCLERMSSHHEWQLRKVHLALFPGDEGSATEEWHLITISWRGQHHHHHNHHWHKHNSCTSSLQSSTILK